MSEVKPKLADGSRWEGNVAVDEDGDRVRCIQYQHAEVIRVSDINDHETARLMSLDALAVIRAAGLDEVWNAAVALSEFDVIDEHGQTEQRKLISKLCQAVEKASER